MENSKVALIALVLIIGTIYAQIVLTVLRGGFEYASIIGQWKWSCSAFAIITLFAANSRLPSTAPERSFSLSLPLSADEVLFTNFVWLLIRRSWILIVYFLATLPFDLFVHGRGAAGGALYFAMLALIYLELMVAGAGRMTLHANYTAALVVGLSVASFYLAGWLVPHDIELLLIVVQLALLTVAVASTGHALVHRSDKTDRSFRYLMIEREGQADTRSLDILRRVQKQGSPVARDFLLTHFFRPRVLFTSVVAASATAGFIYTALIESPPNATTRNVTVMFGFAVYALTLTITETVRRKNWTFLKTLPISFQRVTWYTLAGFYRVYALPLVVMIAISLSVSAMVFAYCVLTALIVPLLGWLIAFRILDNQLLASIVCGLIVFAYIIAQISISFLVLVPTAILLIILIVSGTRKYSSLEAWLKGY